MMDLNDLSDGLREASILNTVATGTDAPENDESNDNSANHSSSDNDVDPNLVHLRAAVIRTRAGGVNDASRAALGIQRQAI